MTAGSHERRSRDGVAAAESVPVSPTGSLTLLIPAHNERTSIGPMLEDVAEQPWVTQLGERLEVIVVDDGSTDGTAEEVRARQRLLPNLRVLRLDDNRGKGLALQAGVRAARGAVIAFVDGDSTFHLGAVPRFAQAVADGADIVVGNRRARGTVFDVATEAIPYIHMRHVLSANFNRIVRLLTPLAVPDTQCGLKVFEADAARTCFERILVGGFVFDVEVLLAAYEQGLRVVSLPVRLRYDSTEPTPQIARMSVQVWSNLLRVARNARRGRYRPVTRPPTR